MTSGLLAGIRVLDMSGYEGIYGARLLSDLGADVVRVEIQTSGPLVDPGPFIKNASGETLSAFREFANINKRVTHVNIEEDSQREALQDLIDASDIVLADHLNDVLSVPENVVLVETSTFGNIGVGSTYLGSDLVGLAAGGLLSLGGYPDTPPVAVYGNQAYMSGGIMTGVAAVMALLDRTESQSPRVDVSVQATLVGALEDATAEYDLRGTVRRRAGDLPREAGTGVFRSSDGYISIVAGKLGTAQAWLNLVAWLQEEGVEGVDELAKEEWRTIEKRRENESLEIFTLIFERYSSTKRSEWLYQEGQGRSIAIAPVNKMSDLLTDPQLNFRDFFQIISSEDFARPLTVPGRPYRLYDLPVLESWELSREVRIDEVTRQWLSPAITGVVSGAEA